MKRQRDGKTTHEEIIPALKAGVAALSVSSLASAKDLVCRDQHVTAILDFFREPVHHTMQVFGMPGTGKTATVHNALTRLKSSTEHEPTAVFLNGYVIQKSLDIYWTLYSHLVEARLGHAKPCQPEECAAQIEKWFRHGWGREVGPCVIVVDEVDKVLQKHPKGLFKIIDWLSLPHAHCKLVTISNSMELAVDAKTKSRLDITKQLVFLPYDSQELKEILTHRVSGIQPKLFADQAVNLLCHQTASHYGDVRRLLQSASAAICGVLMKIEEGTFLYNPKEGIVCVKDIHGVVRQIFHDRFIEFVKTVRSPILYITILVLGKEAERLHSRNLEDNRLPLEPMLFLVRHAQERAFPTQKLISRAAFVELMELLRQVSMIDLSVGADRIPLRSAKSIFDSTDDVFVALLQPYQTVVDSCRLHDEFGSTLGKAIP